MFFFAKKDISLHFAIKCIELIHTSISIGKRLTDTAASPDFDRVGELAMSAHEDLEGANALQYRSRR